MNPTLARLQRLLVMVPWLLDHPGVHVEEVAERFDVAPGDVLDDLDVLGYCGLPGYGGGDLIEVSISGDRVAVRMAEFFARPLALSVREGLALLMAARASRDSGILAEGHGPLESAIDKLTDHLGGPAGLPVVLDIDAGGSDLLRRLMPAVADQRVVRITYRSASKEETTVREVEPWALRSTGGAWYLQGYCRMAEDARAFRLDRIRDLEVSDERAPDPPDEPPRPPVYEPTDADPVVVIDVGPESAWITDHVVLSDREQLADGRLRLTFRAATLEWAASLLVRLGATATVVTPDALRDVVRARVEDVLVNYGQG